MHNKTYNINVACFCNENFTKSLEEIKSFFGFNLVSKNINNKDLIDGKFNAIIMESENNKKVSLQDIMIPKILIQKNNKSTNSNSSSDGARNRHPLLESFEDSLHQWFYQEALHLSPNQ